MADDSIGTVLERKNKRTDQSVADKVVSQPDTKPDPIPRVVVEEKEETREQRSASPAINTEESLPFTDLYPHLGITHATDDERRKLGEIWSFLQGNTVNPNKHNMTMKLIKLKNKLGQPRYGESLLDRVFRHVKLKNQEALIQEQLKGD